MGICEYFLRGGRLVIGSLKDCRFGQNCRNEHPSSVSNSTFRNNSTVFQSGYKSNQNQNQNRFNSLSEASQNRPYNFSQNSQNRFNERSSSGQSSISANDMEPDQQTVNKDLIHEKPLWPFSSYSHAPGEINLIRLCDWSPEEARYEYLWASHSGTLNNYNLQTQQRYAHIQNEIKALLANPAGIYRALKEDQKGKEALSSLNSFGAQPNPILISTQFNHTQTPYSNPPEMGTFQSNQILLNQSNPINYIPTSGSHQNYNQIPMPFSQTNIGNPLQYSSLPENPPNECNIEIFKQTFFEFTKIPENQPPSDLR